MAGFIVFLSIYLWGTNKKRFFLVIIACGLVTIMASQKVENIFWQTGQHMQTGQHDLDAASSGRLTIWHHNIQIFLDSSIPQQIIGRGLGIEARKDIDSETDVWSSHNNFLNLLMSLGVIGLFIYLTLLAALLWDIYTCKLDKSAKYLFVGIVVSNIVMSFLSNAFILRLELSQYFWLFMGFFYFAKDRVGADQLSSTEYSRYCFPK
jgi:O-antigen ligase